MNKINPKHMKINILALIIVFLSACSSDKKSKLKIGVSLLSLQSEYIVNLNDAMQKKADEMDVELIVVDGEKSALKQIEQVESFIAQKVDAIILNPCEVEACSPAVLKARQANIPLINVNSVTSEKPMAFVGSDDVESGRMAMQYIADKLGGKGNVLIIHGFMGQAAQLQREKGAKEILKKYPNIKVLAEQTAEWDRAKAMDLTENWIQLYGKQINAIFAHNDEMGLGAVKALEAAGLKNNVIVISIDAIADALQAIKTGSLDATLFQNSVKQGASAVEVAIKIAKKQKFIESEMIPFVLVESKNVGEYIK
jgi:inositol transport system substrate-binding protein